MNVTRITQVFSSGLAETNLFEVKDNQIPETTLQKPTIVYGDVIIGVHGENFSMMFDKKEGGISSLKYNDFEYITRTPKVSFWRAMTDNDTGASEPYNLAQWYAAGKFAKYKTVSWLEQEDALKITFTYFDLKSNCFFAAALFYLPDRLSSQVQHNQRKNF